MAAFQLLYFEHVDLVVFTFLSLLTFARISGNCEFEDNTAVCWDHAGGVPIKTKVVFHWCHKPIDATFYVQVKEPLVRWNHTFVTSNQGEIQEIPGFAEKVALHVQFPGEFSEDVLVKADFHTNDICGRLFLDSTVHVGDKNSCLVQASSLGGQVTAAVIVGLLLVSLTGTSIYLFYRHRRNALDRLALVDDMEAGLPGASPYQEGSSMAKKKNMRYSLKVEYRNGNESSGDVIIQNGFVGSLETNHVSSPTI